MSYPVDRRRPAPSAPRQARLRLLVRVASGALAAALGGLIVVFYLYASVCDSPCIDPGALKGLRPDEPSLVYDRAGRVIGRYFLEDRQSISLADMPSHVRTAFIAVEDQRFYEHAGTDFRRIPGALVRNIIERRTAQGFSTITMQLARNAFPKLLPYREKTLRRKLLEIRIAREMERTLSKDEIYEIYLNTIFLGQRSHGVEMAARTYFGKPAEWLTVGEAALLAALPKAPNDYDPYRYPEKARGRRNLVLALMRAQNHISEGTYQRALMEPVALVRAAMRPPKAASFASAAPYFIEDVRKWLEGRFGQDLYREGLQIHTTLDLAVQQAAESALEAQVRRIEEGSFGSFSGPVRQQPERRSRRDRSPPAPRDLSYLQGAVLVIDADQGDVLAMVGGRSWDDSRFNRATQALRQPGSAFKPFVYAAALTAGYTPADTISDGPVTVRTEAGQTWSPQNFREEGYAGGELITVQQALERSRNRATVRLSQSVGVELVNSLARKMGLGSALPNVPSVVLGAAEVRLVDLVAAYTPLAREDGRTVTPRLVTRVVDRAGRVLLEQEPRRAEALPPRIAATLREMLRGVVDRGTGTAVREAGYDGPAAGKTGTTNRSTDVWFVGATPELVAGVWIGFDQPREILPGTLATGGRLAAPVWAQVVMAARQGRPPREWGVPTSAGTWRAVRDSILASPRPRFLRGDTLPNPGAEQPGPLEPLPLDTSAYLYAPIDTTRGASSSRH